MITMQLLSRVLLEHLITKLFGKPGRAILTTFRDSEVEVVTRWSGDDLKIDIKKVKGRISGDKRTLQRKKIWTPGDPGGVVKPKKIILSGGQ